MESIELPGEDMMKALATAILSVVCWTATALGQTSGDELAALRNQLGMKPDFKITMAPETRLPEEPVKLYLAIGLDTALRRNYQNWVDEWNRKDGKKVGQVELVPNMDDATVVLARYILSDRVSAETNTVPMTTMVYNPATNQLESRTISRTYSDSFVPCFSYILRRSNTGLEVVWRDTGSASPETTKRSGRAIWNDLLALMKTHAKVNKK